MEIKENCGQWVRLVYEDWLTWVRMYTSEHYLRESTQNIVQKMKEAASNSSSAEAAWNTLERLKRLADNFAKMGDDSGGEDHKYEPAEIYLECAVTAYQMGDINEAIQLFRYPVGNFRSRSLLRAIAYWLMGCVQWQMPAHLEDALTSWERSLQITKDVCSDSHANRATVEKCREMQKLMGEAIYYASIYNCPPPAPQDPKPANSPGRRRSARLMIFPVYGRIPAGPAEWIPPHPDGHAESESVIVNGKEYTIYSLRDELTIQIQAGKEYFLLEVKGDSMNRTKPVRIESGDLVLMIKQDTAMNGDIVAAEIIHLDEAATLKRYRYRNGEHRLEAETTNPNLPAYISMDKNFYIRGVAIAVLKPL